MSHRREKGEREKIDVLVEGTETVQVAGKYPSIRLICAVICVILARNVVQCGAVQASVCG